MILIQLIGDISWPSNTGGKSTEDTELIWCVDGQDNQIHKTWCLGLEKNTLEVHTTAQVEVPAGTAGEFVTN